MILQRLWWPSSHTFIHKTQYKSQIYNHQVPKLRENEKQGTLEDGEDEDHQHHQLAPYYVAIFLDATSKQRIDRYIEQLHATRYADHVTLAYKPSLETCLSQFPIGSDVSITLRGIVSDQHAQVISVTLPTWVPYLNDTNPHITVSCDHCIPPAYAGALLDATLHAAPHDIKQIKYLHVVHGTIGVCLADKNSENRVIVFSEEVLLNTLGHSFLTETSSPSTHSTTYTTNILNYIALPKEDDIISPDTLPITPSMSLLTPTSITPTSITSTSTISPSSLDSNPIDNNEYCSQNALQAINLLQTPRTGTAPPLPPPNDTAVSPNESDALKKLMDDLMSCESNALKELMDGLHVSTALALSVNGSPPPSPPLQTHVPIEAAHRSSVYPTYQQWGGHQMRSDKRYCYIEIDKKAHKDHTGDRATSLNDDDIFGSTINATDEDIENFRREMKACLKSRDKKNREAAKALSMGYAAQAKIYRNVARLHGRAAAGYRRKASFASYINRNKSNLNLFVTDLHGMYVTDALEVLKKTLEGLLCLEYPGSLIVKCITGTGNNSLDKKAKLLPSCIEFLAENGYFFDVEEHNPGVLTILVSPGDLLLLEDEAAQ